MHFWHKFISSSKNLFIISFIFIRIRNKTFNNGILLKRILIPKLLNKLFASCSLINFDFLIPEIEQYCNEHLLLLLNCWKLQPLEVLS